MDTLYALCRCEDNRHPLPLTPATAAEIVDHKETLFRKEAENNELLRQILAAGRIDYHGLGEGDHRRFIPGQASFFRAYEILRRNRRTNLPLTLGGEEFEHNAVVEMFGRCVPNAKLKHIPWFSPARYRTSIGIGWGLTVLAAYFAAGDNEGEIPLDFSVLIYLGIVATVTAIAFTALRKKRDARRTIAANAAMYLDLNADLIKRHSPALAVARKEVLPRPRWFKSSSYYRKLAGQIEQHAFDPDLGRMLPASPPASLSHAART